MRCTRLLFFRLTMVVLIVGPLYASLAIPLSTSEIAKSHTAYEYPVAVTNKKRSTTVIMTNPSSSTQSKLTESEEEVKSEMSLPITNLRSSTSKTSTIPSVVVDQQQRQDQESHPANQPSNVKEYVIKSHREIGHKINKLADLYPNFVTLQTAQEAYDLPKAGSTTDCPYEHNDNDNSKKGCYNYIMTIQDYKSHPIESQSWKELPEVLLSGCLHGNERVGPTAVVETAQLLLEAVSCEAKPSHPQPTKRQGKEYEDWMIDVEAGKVCRQELYDKGIDDSSRRWLARMVSTRRIVIVPTANALGYFRNQREEDGVDPNRDFPYDLQHAQLCMQTIAGRTINEIFREHMFQLSITFHGGMEIVSYEWGAPTYRNKISPDEFAQKEISDGYSKFAGKFEGTGKYPTGSMNDNVYPVRGGMEDWAYAGSWDTDRVIQCEPTEYGGYDKEKTTYNDSSLRTFNILVETSDSKIPTSHLGTSQDIFQSESYETNGHIARNIRMSLMSIDLVEPYASISSVNGVKLSNDVIPMVDWTDGSCQTQNLVKVPKGQKDTTIEWTVGGGFSVDYTSIIHSRWTDLSDTVRDTCQLDENNLSLSFTSETATTSGRTYWHEDGPDPAPSDSESKTKFAAASGPVFSASFDTSQYQPGDQIAVFASVRLDQGWKEVPDSGVAPVTKPMSHIVNARTDSEWRHESAGKIVQGREIWYSIPLTLVIGDGDISVTEDLSNRFRSFITGDDDDDDEDGKTANEESDDEEEEESGPEPSKSILLSIIAAVVVGIFLIMKAIKYIQKRRYQGRKRIDDLSAFDAEFVYDDENEIQLREFS